MEIKCLAMLISKKLNLFILTNTCYEQELHRQKQVAIDLPQGNWI